ncbi:MAG: hypothetical protein N838_16560 [Thiohalocapsa sp. PB-PSB1]|nr:MAG: hypothetical protein N838_16560 [Thiohalocapsa sp. PB-PSB1]
MPPSLYLLTIVAAGCTADILQRYFLTRNIAMARQFSSTQFLRRVPNGLLARYFKERHGVLEEIDFGSL